VVLTRGLLEFYGEAGSKAGPWRGDAGRLDVVVQLTVVGGGITQTSNASAVSKGRLGNLNGKGAGATGACSSPRGLTGWLNHSLEQVAGKAKEN
jgi:hypothetical protein